MSPEYKVNIIIPYSFTVEAEDEQEAEYKAFEEFLNFEGPPDYQPSNAVIQNVEKTKLKEGPSTCNPGPVTV